MSGCHERPAPREKKPDSYRDRTYRTLECSGLVSTFIDSLIPLPMDASARQPVREMLEAGMAAGVGPMAAVAGTIAEFVGRGLFQSGIEDLIIENGGDQLGAWGRLKIVRL